MLPTACIYDLKLRLLEQLMWRCFEKMEYGYLFLPDAKECGSDWLIIASVWDACFFVRSHTNWKRDCDILRLTRGLETWNLSSNIENCENISRHIFYDIRSKNAMKRWIVKLRVLWEDTFFLIVNALFRWPKFETLKNCQSRWRTEKTAISISSWNC